MSMFHSHSEIKSVNLNILYNYVIISQNSVHSHAETSDDHYSCSTKSIASNGVWAQ